MTLPSTRRAFLIGSGGFAGAALIPVGMAGAVPREAPLLSTHVAGTAYCEDADILTRLNPGDRLRLLRERDNSYDPLAISIWSETGAKLGYVPRVANQAVANLMDSGFQTVAIVRSVANAGARSELRVDVRLIG